MKLYPRLPRRFATDEFTRQASLSSQELADIAAASHPFQVWPATGAPRITPEELRKTRSHLVAAAGEHGWPVPLARDEQRELDLEVARILWERTELTAAEASFGDAWSFLALVVVPDLVWWRAAGSTNVERFVGVDLTRHTLARLWWRAHLFTWALDDPEAGWELWRSSVIGEADLDQIQTRRGGYGQSPKVLRSLVRLYPHVTTIAVETGVDRRDLWRQTFLRWVLRLGAFTDFTSLSEQQLDEELAAVAASQEPAAVAADLEPTPQAGHEDGVPTIESADQGDFDAQPLQTIVLRLTEAVRAQGQVSDVQLCATLESVSGITIPRDRQEVVRGIAWQAKTLRYLIRSDDDGVPGWRPGSVLPAADRRWGEWTIDSFKQHVARSNDDPDIDELAAALFSGRPGKTVRRLVAAAIRETGPRH
jgi:hypothetical protein